MQCNPNRIWYYREMKLKKGMRVRRSEIALKMLRSMGLDHEDITAYENPTKSKEIG